MEEQERNLLNEFMKILGGGDIVEIRQMEKLLKKLLPSLTDKIDVIACNNALFNSLVFLKRNGEALEYLNNLLEMDQEYESQYHYLQEMAGCYMRMNQKEKGLLMFQQAFDLAQKENDYWGMADISRCVALYYYLNVDFLKSMEYLSDVIHYARKAHNLPMESEAHLRMGSIFYRQKRYNLALESLREAEYLALDSKHYLFAYQATVKRCKVYMELGETKKVTEIIDTLFYLDELSNFKKDENTCQ